MPTATIRARTKPYPDRLLSNERVCARCGIKYRFRPDRENWTECRDCRDVEGNFSRPERAYRIKGVFDPSKCGFTKGYSQHKAYGVPVCPACREANRIYERDRKRAKSKSGRTRSPHPSPCGTPGAYARHRIKGEPVDDACRAANSAAAKERRDRTKDAA